MILYIVLWMLILCGSASLLPAQNSAAEVSSLSADTIGGFARAKMLMSLAEECCNTSFEKSFRYCQELKLLLQQTIGNSKFQPEHRVFFEPDSILDIRARLYFTLGKYYYHQNELNDQTDTLLSENFVRNMKLALSNFEIFYNIRLHQGNEYNVAEAANALALTYSALGQDSIAISLYEKNLKIFQDINSKKGLAKTCNNLAVFYQDDTSQYSTAIRYFRMAMQYSLQDSCFIDYISSASNLSHVYMKMNRLDMSVKLLDDVLAKSKTISDYVIMKGVYAQLSEVYYQLGRYREAFDYLSMYTDLKDSLIGEDSQKKALELNARYEDLCRELEISELRAQKEENEKLMEYERCALNRQRVLTIVFVVIAILLAASVLVVLLEKRRRKYSNEQLKESTLQIYNKNNQITEQKNIIDKMYVNFNHSLEYASRLQRIIIRGNKDVKELLKDFFVIYRPKDVVSGDFFYVREWSNFKVVAVADCTGHGVPAAFLSVLNITFFNEIFSELDSAPHPGDVLDTMRTKVVRALNQSADFYSSTDGMDCALVVVDKKKKIVEYAGAYVDLLLLRSGSSTVEVLKSTRNPVGWYFRKQQFKTNILDVKPNDIIYLGTDGYADQIEPEYTEKYTNGRLRRALEAMAGVGLPEQRERLLSNLIAWQKNAEQIDDVLMMGIRVASLFD